MPTVDGDTWRNMTEACLRVGDEEGRLWQLAYRKADRHFGCIHFFSTDGTDIPRLWGSLVKKTNEYELKCRGVQGHQLVFVATPKRKGGSPFVMALPARKLVILKLKSRSAYAAYEKAEAVAQAAWREEFDAEFADATDLGM